MSGVIASLALTICPACPPRNTISAVLQNGDEGGQWAWQGGEGGEKGWTTRQIEFARPTMTSAPVFPGSQPGRVDAAACPSRPG